MHITTGSPPLLRIDGSMVPLKLPPLSPVETKQLCYSVLTEEQKVAVREEQRARPLVRREEPVPLPRQHLHAARRGGRRLPAIPFKILSFDELGLPPVVAEHRRKPARPGPGHGPDRLGQDRRRSRRIIDKINSRDAPAHHDDRGPDRVPAPAQAAALVNQREVGADTHVVQGRAQVRPAPGSRRRCWSARCATSRPSRPR